MKCFNFSSVVSGRNKFSLSFKFFSILLLVLLVSGKSWGQANISAGTTYSQNFNSIGTTATATLPTGWVMEKGTAVRTVTAAYTAVTGTATTYALAYNAAMSSSAGNGFWNFGGGASSGDQAVGGISSGSASQSVNMFLKLNNNGASTIPNFTISYVAKRFRNGTNAAGFSIRFYTSTTGLANSWTEVTGNVLSFTGANADNNGNATNPLETKSITNYVYNQSLAASSSIYFAWSYSVTSGTTTSNAQALGIDNVSIVAGSSTSNDATLSAMTLSSGTLAPTFASATTSYTATVSNATSSITVTPTRNQANATIQARVNGGTYSSVTSGSASGSLALNVGTNTVDVLVTAQDGTTTKTYTTTVTRQSNDASLSAMSISAGTLTPSFASGTITYTATVPYTSSSITVTPTRNEANAIIQARVNSGSFSAVTSGSPSGSLALNVGPNTVDVLVTAQDGTTKTYTTTVTRTAVATDATLSALALSVGTLSPSFASGTIAYNASVGNGTAAVTVTPTQTNVFASIQVRVNSGTYTTVTSGTASGSLSLNVGDNPIDVKVTAQDGTTIITYIVTVTRAAAAVPTISAVGTLSAVSTTYGTASASPTSFTVSGSAMNAGITVTAPAGFEVSTTSDFSSNVGNNASPITVGAAGTISNTTIYVRLKATATYAGSPYSGNIALTSADATQVDVATASSTVSKAALTITGLTGVSKPYDGGTTALLIGTAVYTGLVNSESFSVSGSPTASFATAAAGDGKTITITGYTAPSTNYTLTDPTVTGNITTVGLSITGISAVSRAYNTTNVATLTGTAAYVGLVNSEVFSVTGTPSATFADANVETAKTVTVTGYTAPSANYTVTQPTGLTADISKADQTISGVSASSTKYVGDADYTFAATSATSATNALSYTSSDPTVATINASTGLVHIVATGETTITVSQDGNANYNAATNATQVLTVNVAPTLLLNEDFDYPDATVLTTTASADPTTGWLAHSGNGTANIDVTVPGLTFNGYVGSGKGGAARLDNNGEDINKTFTSQSSGTVYSAFMLQTQSSNSAGYFFMLSPSPVSTTFYSRVWVNATGDGIGISGSSAPASYISITPATTVLVVVKHDFNTHVSSLFVLNTFSTTEPATPSQTFTETATSIGGVALRQYNAAQRQIVDGIRVTTSWSDLPVTFSGTGVWSETARWNTASVPATTDKVVINGNATINSNITINDLTINSGKSVTVNPTKQLTISSSMVNNGTLNLNSDETGSATILTPTSITGSGTTNVQQYLTTGRNWYVSSPISGATTNVFSASVAHPLYWYDEAHGTSAPWAQITNTTTGLTVMKGYVANIASSGVVTYNGTLNTGTQSITINRTAGQTKEGFSLVGNPYASYLDWDQISKTDLLSSIWYRTKTSGGAYTFDTYNSTGGVATGNGVKLVTNLIPPMQAFWVRVDVGKTQATVLVDNSKRGHVDNSNNGFKVKALNTQPIVHLQVSNGINADETIIYSNPNASDSYDAYDSPKMFSNSAVLAEIYTVANSEDLTINGLNAIPYDSEIALGFSTSTSGNYSIKASQISNFASGTQIVLRDNLLNYQQDLTLAEYNFYSDVTAKNVTRFTVLFKVPSVATGINQNSTGNIWISLANNQIVVNGANGETNVAVYNEVGQRLVSQRLTESTKSLGTFVSGVYMVTVTNAGKSATTKVIIK